MENKKIKKDFFVIMVAELFPSYTPRLLALHHPLAWGLEMFDIT